MNKREPFELLYCKLLPQSAKDKVEKFVNNLHYPHKEFAYKRYYQNKAIRVIAEEMGYEERSLYKYRNDIIELWERFYDDDKSSYHRERVISALRRHGKLEYSKLLMNMNLKRSGLNLEEFKDILRLLVASGEVVCLTYRSEGSGKQKKLYALRKFVNNLSEDEKLILRGTEEQAGVINRYNKAVKVL